VRKCFVLGIFVLLQNFSNRARGQLSGAVILLKSGLVGQAD